MNDAAPTVIFAGSYMGHSLYADYVPLAAKTKGEALEEANRLDTMPPGSYLSRIFIKETNETVWTTRKGWGGL